MCNVQQDYFVKGSFTRVYLPLIEVRLYFGSGILGLGDKVQKGLFSKIRREGAQENRYHSTGTINRLGSIKRVRFNVFVTR
jgi:hypothetical protein